MNFFRRSEEDDPIVPMAPMIDIIFLLLIFFISTSIYARLENEISITVPSAEAAEPSRRLPNEIIINLTREGEIVINQQRLTLEQLEHRLSRIAENTPGLSVIIRGDKNAVFGLAIDVLDACSKVGIWNVSFAATPEQIANGR